MISGRQTGSSDTLIKLTGKEIADDLERRIRAGEYAADQRLDFAELANLYEVSRSTIQRAMGLLEDRGLVEYLPGRGRYVTPSGDQ